MRVVDASYIKEKRVLLRADFNVPIENGVIREDFRIRAVIPTITLLKDSGARAVIIISHLGRPEGKWNETFTLEPIVTKLQEFLGDELVFIKDRLQEAKAKIEAARPGSVILLENIRFYPGEEENDGVFAKELAALGDVYVNDAFGVSHRAHASVDAVTRFLPSYAGLLLQKEIASLSRLEKDPPRPFVVIMGGAKVATKLKTISRLLPRVDHIMLGGIIANTLLSAKGLTIGKSKSEAFNKGILNGIDIFNTKLHLPIDVVVSREMSGSGEMHVTAPGKVGEDEMILDIGPETRGEYAEIIKNAKTVVWNGPVGLFEVRAFAEGTKHIADAVCDAAAFRVVGGGDVIRILEEMHVIDTIDYVSTGGGAMLEFLAGEKLPGIEALNH